MDKKWGCVVNSWCSYVQICVEKKIETFKQYEYVEIEDVCVVGTKQ